MDSIKAFENAVSESKQLPDQSNENLLLLYSLYKQATEGDCNIEKPTNLFDFKGIAKFNAWDGLRGMNHDEAKMKYVELVNRLKK